MHAPRLTEIFRGMRDDLVSFSTARRCSRQVVRRRHAQLSIGHHAPLDAEAEVGQAVLPRRVVVLVSMRTALSVRQNHPRYPGLRGSPYCAICKQERKIMARKPWRESRGVKAAAVA